MEIHWYAPHACSRYPRAARKKNNWGLGVRRRGLQVHKRKLDQPAVLLAAILCDPELAKFRRMFLLIVRFKGVRLERNVAGTGFLAARRQGEYKQKRKR